MIICFVFFISGLVIGWNFFPQPKMVRELVEKLFGRKSGDKYE